MRLQEHITNGALHRYGGPTGCLWTLWLHVLSVYSAQVWHPQGGWLDNTHQPPAAPEPSMYLEVQVILPTNLGEFCRTSHMKGLLVK